MTDKVGLNRGRAGQGRPRGSPNKVTALLRDAILQAAETTGEDGSGKDGLVGYCTFLAREEPRAFVALLGKVLPMQITGAGGEPISTVTRIELVPVVPRRLEE